MKSYSDDIPNIAKEEFTKAQEKSQKSIDVAEANLAATHDLREFLAKSQMRMDKKAMVTNIILGLTFLFSLGSFILAAKDFFI